MVRAIIVSDFGENPLEAFHSTLSLKQMKDRLEARYEAATDASKVNILTTFVNTVYKSGEYFWDSIADLEFHFSKQASLCLSVAERMQVATLLDSVMDESALKDAVAAWVTVKYNNAT